MIRPFKILLFIWMLVLILSTLRKSLKRENGFRSVITVGQRFLVFLVLVVVLRKVFGNEIRVIDCKFFGED